MYTRLEGDELAFFIKIEMTQQIFGECIELFSCDLKSHDFAVLIILFNIFRYWIHMQNGGSGP